ncbi:plasmid maintenance protein [Borreliella japonica]|uniref:plasmid maintenance protein n=1 Tax=Borreliella japonica TaxID=34095 RepID=UPI003AF0AC1B
MSILLERTKKILEEEGLNKKKLEIYFQNVYSKYENKPHFILDNGKYDDLKQIINKIKKNTDKSNIKTTQENIKNNILNILFEQLKIKSEIDDNDNEFLIRIIKDYLNQIGEPRYSDLFNNKYYHDLLKVIKNKNKFLINEKFII